jgi:hypothetical protein
MTNLIYYVFEKRIGPSWCRFDQLEYVTKDLSKQSNDFLWLHLFHDVLLHLPCGQQVKRQKILDQFKHEYQPNEAIRRFMKQSLLRKTIDKALQTEDTNQLYTLRYFLGDLVQNLRQEHRQQMVQSDRKQNLTVYQEMKLSNDEFNKLQEDKGKLISMKGFLIATTEQSPSPSPSRKMMEPLRCIIEH